MNLIEQFGYEKAKDALDQLKREKKDLLTVGKTVLVRAEIEQNLLEYRRQHNIFEVGDDVIGLSADEFGDDVIRITRLFEFLGVSCFEYEATNHTGDDEISLVRHATDEEIKAGKRL